MITFKVTPDGEEPYDVKAGSRDIVFWEKTTKGAALIQLREGLKLTDLYKIAWIACRRQSLFAGSLEDFEKNCEIDYEEEPEPDPTPPAPSPEN